MNRWLFLAVGLSACTPKSDVQWLEGFAFDWSRFNHRVSYIGVDHTLAEANVTVVGGTSTTGENTDLPDTCDPDTCDELPFTDTAPVEVWVGRAEIRGAIGTGIASLEVAADGSSTTIDIPLEGRVTGDAVAIIDGWSLDTDHPLSSGPSCYDPAFGWLPTRIQLAVSEPTVTGDTATVDVSAAFEAGNTLEDIRECIDAVATDAVVLMMVSVRVVTAKGEVSTQTVSQSDAWQIREDQPFPEAADRPLEVPTDGVLGWSALDYRFHVDDPDRRGAYLRTLHFHADAIGGAAIGHATNASATQLSGFDYTFEGTVTSLSLGQDITRRVASDVIDIVVEEDGTYAPIPVSFERR